MNDTSNASNDLATLMTNAQKQLDEHAAWLAAEITNLTPEQAAPFMRSMLVIQTKQIKLRMARADKDSVSVVWDYPDELGEFLRERAPDHLRASLAGGHLVEIDAPSVRPVSA
jgi:hypothetical protein